MNELYGVDPAAPGNSDELAALLEAFGPLQGRFILDVPNDWVGHARSVCDGLGPMARMRALEHLVRSQRAVIRSELALRPGLSWTEVAASLAGRVDGLVGRRHCPPNMMPIQTLLDAPEVLPDAGQTELPRLAPAYVQAAWPLLCQVPKLVIVDAQMQLLARLPVDVPAVGRYRRVLQLLLAEAARRQRVVVVEVHVLESKALEGDPGGRRFQAELEALARRVGAGHLELSHARLPEARDVSHRGAYLLGAGCGLHFQRGLDTAEDGSTNRVQWLDGPRLAPLLERFDLPDH